MKRMPWSNVVACLVVGATFFGCMAIEPTGTLIIVMAILGGLLVRGERDDED
jgi:hypothetical protein